MQFIAGSDLGVRAASYRLQRRDTALSFLLLPMLHVGERVPLPDGDIDYRFALTAMHAAGYHGYVAVEGLPLGDQLTADGRSAAYVREILRELERA